MAQVAATIALLVVGGFLYYRYAPRHAPRGQPALTTGTRRCRHHRSLAGR